MGLLDGRLQRPIPKEAKRTLAEIPEHFRDDGCSSSPDDLFGFDFRWACRIHDWRYCTRCHPAGSMTWQRKNDADGELKENIRTSLPWRWRWVRFLYHRAVFIGGNFGAYDTCGPEAAECCRHGMAMPGWMRALASETR